MTINPVETILNASQRLHRVLETSDPLTLKLSSSLSQCLAGLRTLCETLSDALPHAPQSKHDVSTHDFNQDSELISLNERLKDLLALEHLGFDDESRLEQAFKDFSTASTKTHIACKLKDRCISMEFRGIDCDLSRC